MPDDPRDEPLADDHAGRRLGRRDQAAPCRARGPAGANSSPTTPARNRRSSDGAGTMSHVFPRVQRDAADRGLGGGRVDHRRRREALPRRRRWRDRGRRRPRRPLADRRRDRAARQDPVRARDAVHHRGARDLRGRARRGPARARRADLPGERRLRGRRDRAQARAHLPPGGRPGGQGDGDRPPVLVPRQHARRARPLREGAAAQAVHAVARPVPARAARLRVPLREPVAPRRMRRLARGGAAADDRVLRPRDDRGVRRRAGRRRDARRVGARARTTGRRSSRSAAATACW